MIKTKNFQNTKSVEVLNSLRVTLSQNDDALDYLENSIRHTQDMLGFSPDDVILQQDLKTLQYIRFSLEYLDNVYRKTYKKYGGKL